MSLTLKNQPNNSQSIETMFDDMIVAITDKKDTLDKWTYCANQLKTIVHWYLIDEKQQNNDPHKILVDFYILFNKKNNERITGISSSIMKEIVNSEIFQFLLSSKKEGIPLLSWGVDERIQYQLENGLTYPALYPFKDLFILIEKDFAAGMDFIMAYPDDKKDKFNSKIRSHFISLIPHFFKNDLYFNIQNDFLKKSAHKALLDYQKNPDYKISFVLLESWMDISENSKNKSHVMIEFWPFEKTDWEGIHSLFLATRNNKGAAFAEHFKEQVKSHQMQKKLEKDLPLSLNESSKIKKRKL